MLLISSICACIAELLENTQLRINDTQVQNLTDFGIALMIWTPNRYILIWVIHIRSLQYHYGKRFTIRRFFQNSDKRT
jgi:hypothetical protein